MPAGAGAFAGAGADAGSTKASPGRHGGTLASCACSVHIPLNTSLSISLSLFLSVSLSLCLSPAVLVCVHLLFLFSLHSLAHTLLLPALELLPRGLVLKDVIEEHLGQLLVPGALHIEHALELACRLVLALDVAFGCVAPELHPAKAWALLPRPGAPLSLSLSLSLSLLSLCLSLFASLFVFGALSCSPLRCPLLC